MIICSELLGAQARFSVNSIFSLLVMSDESSAGVLSFDSLSVYSYTFAPADSLTYLLKLSAFFKILQCSSLESIHCEIVVYSISHNLSLETSTHNRNFNKTLTCSAVLQG